MKGCFKAWLADSLHRIYPHSASEDGASPLLAGARGERLSFQIGCRTGAVSGKLRAEIEAGDSLITIVRRVGFVPLLHVTPETPAEELETGGAVPGMVPDPLLPENETAIGCFETAVFWVTLRITPEASAGRHKVDVQLKLNEETVARLKTEVVVYPCLLPERVNFPVTNWFYADALLDWYGLQPFEEKFWSILSGYMTDLVEHGQDTIYTPVFTPSLDGVKRPTQLLRVAKNDNGYLFDWSLVKRWVDTARSCGIRNFEWAHLFTQWGAAGAIRIYEGHGLEEQLLWPPDTGAISDVYRAFLSQYLPQLHSFLDKERLLKNSFFHLSDEPHGEEHLINYRSARNMLQELAPWMKIMDALSEISFAREGLTDIPIPSINNAPEFIAEGFPAWAYFCCGPRGKYLNRFLDTPLLKIRMTGWLLYRHKAQGFLHWGGNYWYRGGTRELINPFHVTDAGRWPDWTFGDPFVIYPGPNGPIDSLRWEIFAESLQDYALLQACGIDPDDALLQDIHDYADFPRDKQWIKRYRQELLERLNRAK